jgi:hypothetical protein
MNPGTHRIARMPLVTAVTVLVALLNPVHEAGAKSAEQGYGLIKIREVFAGGANPSAQFVELQVIGPDESLSGDFLALYKPGEVDVCDFPHGGPVRADQQHILISTAQAQAEFPGVTPEYIIPASLSRTSGAVCISSDCVSWGSFDDYIHDDSKPNFAGGIPSGQSIDRDISAGNPSTLEETDDTSSSQADFDGEAPSPEPSHPSGPIELDCGPQSPTVLDLTTKVRRGTVTVTGRLDHRGTSPVVKIKLLAKGSGSPFKTVDGAVDGLDQEGYRFEARLDVPGDAKRCKVIVRHGGDIVGEKEFKC